MIRYAVAFRSTEVNTLMWGYNKWLAEHSESEPKCSTQMVVERGLCLVVTFEGSKADAEEAATMLASSSLPIIEMYPEGT